MLVMNPLSTEAQDKKRLPLFIYEMTQTQEDLEKKTGKTSFVPIEFTLASSDSEQISVNDVAHAVDKDAKVSGMSQQMASALNAVKILRSKLNFLIAVVQQSPEIRKNHAFMRRLNQIVASTPIVAQSEFDNQVFGEYSDAVALNLLATVTKSCGQLQELISDFNVINTASGSDLGSRTMGRSMKIHATVNRNANPFFKPGK